MTPAMVTNRPAWRYLDRGRRLCRSRWPLLAGLLGGLALALAAITYALI